MLHLRALLLLSHQPRRQPGPFVIRQPARIRRPVGEVEQHHHRQHQRRQRLDNEQPLPARQPARSIQPQQQAGNRRANHRRQRDRRHERGNNPPAIHRREPQRDVEDNPREEAGFRQPKQYPDGIEGIFLRHPGRGRNLRNKRHQPGQQAPADHNPRNPLPRAKLIHKQIGWHFEQEVGDKEDTGAETEHLGIQPQRLIHRQRCEADIHPVEIGNEITNDQKRNQSP